MAVGRLRSDNPLRTSLRKVMRAALDTRRARKDSRQTGHRLQPDRPRGLRHHRYVSGECCLASWENLASILAPARHRCRHRYKATT
jgi:hypothetical protein